MGSSALARVLTWTAWAIAIHTVAQLELFFLKGARRDRREAWWIYHAGRNMYPQECASIPEWIEARDIIQGG